MTAQRIYLMRLRAEKASVDVLVNDVRVTTASDPSLIVKQVVINPYVQSGVNEITLKVRPVTVSIPKVTWQLVKTHRDPAAPDIELAAGVIPMGLSASSELAVNQTVQIDEAFGAWAWESVSTPFEPTKDTDGVVATVQDLWNALDGRDRARWIELQSLKFQELARALQMSPQSLVESAHMRLDQLFADRDWALRPIRAEDVIVEPMAHGRAVSVGSRVGSAPIESLHGTPYRLDILLASVQDSAGASSWRLVR